MRCKKNLLKPLVTTLLLSISSFHVYADSLSGSVASVVDALPEGLQLALSTTLSRDSNIFRQPDSTVKADTITSTQTVLTYNKTYGMQNLTLEATLSHNKFSNFSYLDNSTNNYKGSWALKIDTNLSGIIGVTQTQTLANFATTQVFSKILYTTQSRFINGDWWARGPWHALLGVSENLSSNSATVTTQQNTKSNASYTGISYLSEAQNTLSLKRQSTTGSYTNTPLNYFYLVDNGYTETDDLLDFNWNLSGKSQLSGELNHLSVKQNHFSQRNYAGMAGNLNYLWSITGKTSLQFTAQRNFGQFLTSYSSYDVTDDFAISPVWKLSEKTTLRASFDQGSVNYLGAINGVPVTARNDTTQTVMFGVDWTPTRTTLLHTSIQRTSRDSNYTIYQYSDNAINMTGQILF